MRRAQVLHLAICVCACLCVSLLRARDWTRMLKDDNPAVRAAAWVQLTGTPWMVRMVPIVHRMEGLTVGVAGWRGGGGAV